MTPVVVAILTLGLSGIVAQVLLLRELLVTFNSNELTIGIVLANWLLAESAGSFLAGRAMDRLRAGREIFAFVGLTLVFCASFPAAVYGARICRELFGVLPGEALGLPQAFVASCLVVFPVSLLHGALFPAACALFPRAPGGSAIGIARVYLWETAGTIAGGVIFTGLLVTRLHSFQVALGLALLNAAACVLLLAARKPKSARIAAAGLATAVLAGFFLETPADLLHRSSIRAQWRGQEVVEYQNSPYGNVAVTRRAEQYTVYADGVPAIVVPTPDVAGAEELAHLTLLHHSEPRSVLVIGGGAGGIIREILRHPVERLDYAELDPLILEMLRRFPTPLTEAELGDPRVRVHHRDGRLLVRAGGEPYDAILLGLTEPQDLQTNRLFTREFFLMAARRLSPGGLLAFRLPGSLVYLSRELADLNGCVLNTLREVFPAVRVLPGDGLNLVLASPSPEVLAAGPDLLARRMADRGLSLRFVNAAYLAYRLDPSRTEWFRESLRGATGRVNRDFEPLGVYFSLSHWNALFAPGFQAIFGALEKVPITSLALLAGTALALGVGVFQRAAGRWRGGVVLAMATTGLAGMVFDLVLLFAFQALYGYVFFWAGILVTAFMAGTALGSIAMIRVLGRTRRGFALLLALEGALALFAAAVPGVFLALGSLSGSEAASAVTQGIFVLLAVAGGALIGLEFPLANKLYLGASDDVGRTVGTLYGADLLGGWVGGVLGGVILLPVAGLARTCLLVAFLKVAALAVLALSGPRGRE